MTTTQNDDQTETYDELVARWDVAIARAQRVSRSAVRRALSDRNAEIAVRWGTEGTS